MRRDVLIATAILLFAMPTAEAESTDEVLALELDSDELVVRMQVTLTNEDAQETREEIDDDFGNGDGIVTMDEVSRYNAEGTMKFTEDAPQCFENFELALIDGKTPTRLSLMSGRAEQATGSTSSISPVRVTASFTFVYPTSGGGTHTAQAELDEMDSFGESIGCFFGVWADGMYDWGGWSGAGPPWCCAESMPRSFTADGPWQAPPVDAAFDQPQDAASGAGDPETILIQPRIGFTFDANSIQPARARPLWDGKGLRADTQTEQLILMDEVVTMQVRGGSASPISGTVRDVGAYVGFGVMGGSLVVLAAAFATEYGRFHLWKLLFLIPGFTRLEKDEVLEHTKRDELYRFIKQNPGPSFSDLRRELALSNGTLVHHLRILESQEYVKGVRDGFRTRFYVRGPKVVMESYLTRTQIQLVEAIAANPGLTQKELAHILGIPRESVSYHTKQLAAKGRLAIKQEGKWRRYWPATAPPSTTTTAPMQA